MNDFDYQVITNERILCGSCTQDAPNDVFHICAACEHTASCHYYVIKHDRVFAGTEKETLVVRGTIDMKCYACSCDFYTSRHDSFERALTEDIGRESIDEVEQ